MKQLEFIGVQVYQLILTFSKEKYGFYRIEICMHSPDYYQEVTGNQHLKF